MSSVDRLIVANARSRNSPSGTSGCFRRAIMIGKATRAAAPIASATNAIGSSHCRCCPRVAPNASPPTARMATTAPSQSKWPVAVSSRDSFMERVAASAMSTSGTLIRNRARQPAASTRMPPIGGPSVASPDVTEAQTPKARARAAPSKVLVMIDSEPGTRSAPARPCSTRPRTSSSRFGAIPHRTDVSPNPTSPIRNILRRPK